MQQNQQCTRKGFQSRTVSAAGSDFQGALQSCIRAGLPSTATKSITPPLINFRDVLTAQLRNMEQVVLQEVARLENAVFQLRSEKDELIRNLAEAKGLMPPRAFRESHELQLKGDQQGEGGNSRSRHVETKYSTKSDGAMGTAKSERNSKAKGRDVEKAISQESVKSPKDNRRELVLQARRQQRLNSSNSHSSAGSNSRKKIRSATTAMPSARSTSRNPSAMPNGKSPHLAHVSTAESRVCQTLATYSQPRPEDAREADQCARESAQCTTSKISSMGAIAAAAAARFRESGKMLSSTVRRTSVQSDPSEASVEATTRVAPESSDVQSRIQCDSPTETLNSLPSPREQHTEEEQQAQLSPKTASHVAEAFHLATRPNDSDAIIKQQSDAVRNGSGSFTINAMVRQQSDPNRDGSGSNPIDALVRQLSNPIRKNTESNVIGQSNSLHGSTSNSSVAKSCDLYMAREKERETSALQSPADLLQKRRVSLISRVSSRSGSSGKFSEDEPMTFELQAIWIQKLVEAPEAPAHKKLRKTKSMSLANGVMNGDEMGFAAVGSALSAVVDSPSRVEQLMVRSCMIPPTSLVCVAWELMGLCMIGYDFAFLPLQIFNLPESLFTVTMEWIQRIFWTISIPFSFFVGYVLKDGKVELRPWKVRRHYCTTWFPFDFTVVVSDWAEVILKTFEFLGAMRLVKTVRVSRILRMIRVFRTIKLPKAMEGLDSRILSEKTVILLGIGKIFLLFACLGHLVACTWYGVGYYGSQDDLHDGWVRHYGYLESSLSYRYMTCLHWALTQFIGSMDIQPQNLAERTFANVMLLCSFVITAWFVSSITAQITRLQIIAGGRDGQFAVLRQYLWHHKISTKLAMRVVRSAQQALDYHTMNASEKDVELLSFVSEPLRAEIHYEMHYNTISVHPFFRHFDTLNRHVVRELCHSAIEVTSVHDGDLVFVAGEVPTNLQMYFVVNGFMGYSCAEMVQIPVTEEMWACEAVLWIEWVHLGDLQAHQAVTILTVDADVFRQVLTKGQREAVVAANYAQRFAEYLTNNFDAVLDVNLCMEQEYWISEAIREVDARAEAMSAESGGRRISDSRKSGQKAPKAAAVVDLSSIGPAN